MSKRVQLNWDYLTQNLSQQVEAYKRLRTLLENENECLLSHRVKKLSELTPHKDTINQHINRLQVQYQEIIDSILIEHQERVSLEWLIGTAPAEHRPELAGLRIQLKQVSQGIYKLNHMNAHLLEQSMKYVSHMMKKMLEIDGSQQQVYCPRGYAKNLGDSQNYMTVVA